MKNAIDKAEEEAVEAAGSAVRAEQVQWRNIQTVLKDVAAFCFGSADDPVYGSCYTAVVTSLTAKDGLSVKLEPLPAATTHPAEPVDEASAASAAGPAGVLWLADNQVSAFAVTNGTSLSGKFALIPMPTTQAEGK